MYDAQATALGGNGGAQEFAQLGPALFQGQPVQINFRLDAGGAAAQPAQHGLRHPWPPELQRVAGLNIKPGSGRQQAFHQHRGALRARETGARHHAPPRWCDALRRGQWAHALHGLPEQLVFFIPVLRHASLRAWSFKYIGVMQILVSNDDGYRAEGIACLRTALRDLGVVTVVAPDRNRSGASNSLTLDVPLRVTQVEPGVHFVAGTPTDCVHLAVSGLFDFEFDMVVSGINDGPNLGDDVLYSGTVAAAIEGRFLGLPTVALSLCSRPDGARHFDTAAVVARRVVAGLLTQPLDPRLILSINVPDVPLSELKGIRSTRLGSRHRSGRALPARDPKGSTVYWIGPVGAGDDAGEGTDFHAVANGWASVTPLSIDLTRHATLPALTQWLDALP